jgi:hypothetical protein
MRLPTLEGSPALVNRQEPVPTKETLEASLASISEGDVATKGK